MEKSEDFYGNEVVNSDAIVGDLGKERFRIGGAPPPIIYYHPLITSLEINSKAATELPRAE